MSNPPRRPVNYQIRNIDPELWARVKKCAAKEGRPIRFVVMALLRLYAVRGYEAIEHFHRKRR